MFTSTAAFARGLATPWRRVGGKREGNSGGRGSGERDSQSSGEREKERSDSSETPGLCTRRTFTRATLVARDFGGVESQQISRSTTRYVSTENRTVSATNTYNDDRTENRACIYIVRFNVVRARQFHESRSRSRVASSAVVYDGWLRWTRRERGLTGGHVW